MAAPNLVEALQSAHFPSDRAQLLDYARRNNLPEGALAVLEAIPDRRYDDVGEVFIALPQSIAEGAAEDAAEAMGTLPVGLEWWMQGWQQMMAPWSVMTYCMRRSTESWPQWMRLAQRMWFPWTK